MKLIVLGAAAGGGFPQWNSNAAACNRARAGDTQVRPRTQASIALTADGVRWLVVNASPDIKRQIDATPALHPKSGLRSSPISVVLLTAGEVDCVAGLLSLRERQGFALYATHSVLDILISNPIFDVLHPDYVRRRKLELNREVDIQDIKGQPLGLAIQAFPVPGKVPLHLEPSTPDPAAIKEDEDAIGLRITETATGASCHFIPGCAFMAPSLTERLRGQNVVLFDGTLWSDDEMIQAGLGSKTGTRMGHMSVGGPDGTIAAFATLDVRSKILIHINNSNPVLLEDSEEHATALSAGWDIAYDGMEFVL